MNVNVATNIEILIHSAKWLGRMSHFNQYVTISMFLPVKWNVGNCAVIFFTWALMYFLSNRRKMMFNSLLAVLRYEWTAHFLARALILLCLCLYLVICPMFSTSVCWITGILEKREKVRKMEFCGVEKMCVTIKARLRIEARSRSRSVWSDTANPLTAWQNRSPELFPPSLKAFKLKAFLLVNILLNDLFGLDMGNFIAISKLKRLIGHVRCVKYQLYNLPTLSSHP